ncbi:hypothetical protein, partial [Frankia sp. EI5c]|uniref:hypothetical protein n=1 Tax=Frankia sp. EI5c TaxID=683316 RepID=UPI001A7E73F8
MGRTLDRYKRMRLHPILQEDTDSNPSVLRYLDAEANYISALPVDGPGSSETNRVTFFFRRFVLSAQLDPEVLRERMHAAVDEGWTR